MNRSCLIMIDWQIGFGDESFWGPRNNPNAEENAANLLNYWRLNNRPIVHVKHDSTQSTSLLSPGKPGNRLQDFAQPNKHEPLYLKNVNSAFIGTNLANDLRERKLTTLVFCGISTDHCISTTVRMSANLGFETILVEDACYTFDRVDLNGKTIAADQIHHAHIASLNGEFAKIMKTAEISGN